MNSIRARWPDRLGLVLSAAAASVGFTLVRPFPVWPGGELLVAWMVATLLIAVPMLVVELATGAMQHSKLVRVLDEVSPQLHRSLICRERLRTAISSSPVLYLRTRLTGTRRFAKTTAASIRAD